MNRAFKPILTTTLLLALGMSTGFSAASAAPQQDRTKTCNDLADKKGLKGKDRKNFVQDCLDKTSGTQSLSDASQRDKLNACKNLADRKNLKGEDRRSFLKDCMNKVNSK